MCRVAVRLRTNCHHVSPSPPQRPAFVEVDPFEFTGRTEVVQPPTNLCVREVELRGDFTGSVERPLTRLEEEDDVFVGDRRRKRPVGSSFRGHTVGYDTECNKPCSYRHTEPNPTIDLTETLWSLQPQNVPMPDRPEAIAGVEDADLDGKTVLVTGSTRGIGREAALAFGRLGATVFVHGRDRTAGENVVGELERIGTEAEFFPADFADIDAVRGLAEAVAERAEEIDVLANNAGGYFGDGRLTDIGVEYTFHVNHLSPFLLTTELLDTLADDARVVTTSSTAHRGSQIDLDAVTNVEDYSSFAAYHRSKLANVQFTAELARRFDATDSDRTANCLHPGAIPGSGFFRFLPGPLSTAARALDRLPFVPSPADGAANIVYLGVSDAVASTSGRYFTECAPETPDDPARDPDAQRRLWERSAELLGVEEPLAEAVEPATAD